MLIRMVSLFQVPDIDSASDEGLKPKEMLGSVELRNVKFRYPARPEVQVRQFTGFLNTFELHMTENDSYYKTSLKDLLICNGNFIII